MSPKCIVIGKTCAIVPKIITGDKYGKAIDSTDIIKMLRQVIKEEPTYKKGNYIATARIAQHYPTAVKNAGIVLQNLLKEGMPGLEDTDERNLWLCKNCRTFSTVQEAVSFLESLKCE